MNQEKGPTCTLAFLVLKAYNVPSLKELLAWKQTLRLKQLIVQPLIGHYHDHQDRSDDLRPARAGSWSSSLWGGSVSFMLHETNSMCGSLLVLKILTPSSRRLLALLTPLLFRCLATASFTSKHPLASWNVIVLHDGNPTCIAPLST